MNAFAFSGSIVGPVVVEIVDEKGFGIEGAKVQIQGSPLEGFPKNQLDSNSDFSKLVRKATGERTTDDLGFALVYCGGGYIPDEKDGGVIAGYSGKVVVRAKGYQDTQVEFDRSFSSKKKGVTELGLRIKVTLKLKEKRPVENSDEGSKRKAKDLKEFEGKPN